MPIKTKPANIVQWMKMWKLRLMYVYVYECMHVYIVYKCVCAQQHKLFAKRNVKNCSCPDCLQTDRKNNKRFPNLSTLPVVELVFKCNYFTQKSQSAKYKERVCALHEHENSFEEIFLQQEILNMIAMMFNAKWQNVQHNAEQLCSLVILVLRTIAHRIEHQRSCGT